MDYIAAIILDYLKANGKATRGELRYLTGLEDRANRRIVERLRRQGEPIGLGYRGGYTWNDPQDVDRIIKLLQARAYRELSTAAALKGRPLDGQLTIEEVFDYVLL